MSSRLDRLGIGTYARDRRESQCGIRSELQSMCRKAQFKAEGEPMSNKDFIIENGCLIRYCGNDENVVIPKEVKKICNLAFEDSYNIRGIFIPAGVTYIEERALPSYGDGRWIKLYFEASDFDELKMCPNYEDSSLDYVVLYGNKPPVGDFIYNSHGYVTGYIGKDKRVVIPQGARKICLSSLSGCEFIESVELPDGVEEICGGAFCRCTALKEISLPSSLAEIGIYAFGECTSLEKIVIPSSVQFVGREAFARCERLKIYCEAQEKPRHWDDTWNCEDLPVDWGYKKA